jgi:uncharacterized delta-60 repeat protein
MLLKKHPFTKNGCGRLFAASTLCAASSLAAAHSGDLNAHYGTTGTATVPTSHEIVQANELVAFDNLGRTVFAMQTDAKNVIGVLTTTGSADTSFGKSGFLKLDTQIHDLKIDSKNRIVVLASDSSTDLVQISRYDSDGKLDKSFGTNGTITLAGSDHIQPASMKLDAGDNIVWVGTDSPLSSFDSYVAVGRLTKRGAIDTTFATSGWNDIHLISGDERSVGQAAAIAHDGGIFVTGYSVDDSMPGPIVSNYVMKLTSHGELDPAFGFGLGFVTSDAAVVGGARYTVANSIAVDGKDNLVIAGSAGNWISFSEFFAARFTSRGDVDTAFNGGSAQLIEPSGYFEAQALSISIDNHDNLVVSGTMESATDRSIGVAVFRLDDSGQQDFSFGDATGFAIAPDAVWGGQSAVNPRGNIVTVGNTSDRMSLKISEMIGYDKRSP